MMKYSLLSKVSPRRYQTRRPRSLLSWPYAAFHGFRGSGAARWFHTKMAPYQKKADLHQKGSGLQSFDKAAIIRANSGCMRP